MCAYEREWGLISHESYLIQACLTNGLTELRKADYFNNRGYFYSASYSLALGIERLCKLTLILDHMRLNKLACPSSGTMKNFGHDLCQLLRTCQATAVSIGRSCDLSFGSSTTKVKIIDLLDRYSRVLRYHNLDTLSGGGTGDDPLVMWSEILKDIFDGELPKRRVSRARTRASVAGALSGLVCVVGHDLTGNPLSLATSAQDSQTVDAAMPYAVWHVIEILKALKELHVEVADLARTEAERLKPGKSVIPYVHEFYRFIILGRSDNIRKKRWLPSD